MITNFQSLIIAAKQQSEPQRLLFLFAKIEPEDSKEANQDGGMISPLMCVDKLPEELTTFASFRDEADDISPEWDLMISIGLAGTNGEAPSSEDAEEFLNQMVSDVSDGEDLSQYIILDRNDNPVLIETE